MFQNFKKYVKRCPALYETLRVPYRFVRKVANFPYELYLDAVALYNMYRVRERIRAEKKDKLTVVFLMQYPESWDKVRTVYECMKKDERFDAKIFCVPMEKEHKEFHLFSYDTNPTYDWFVKKGYVDAINALVGKDEWYNLKELKPDYVFYTRPYNILLPKQYRSSEVSKYALISVMWYGICLYVNLAVAVYAKDFFREVYLLVATCRDEKKIFSKINVLNTLIHIQCWTYGLVAIESALNKRFDVTKIWQFAGKKKRILWTPRWSTDEHIGGSNFIKYKDFILGYAKNHQEVAILIRPHPLMFLNFEQTGEMTVDERESFFQRCEDLGNVKIDQTHDYVATFWNTDILLTDFSSIIPEFYVTGKPIIYCEWRNGYKKTELMNDMCSSMYIANNYEDISGFLKQVFTGNDPLNQRRHDVIEKHLLAIFSQDVTNEVYSVFKK